MARAMILLWALTLILLVPAISVVAQTIGVNWGTITFRQLDPNIVVKMLHDNGFKKVKLFEPDSGILDALAGTDIEVMLGIPNYFLQSLSSDYKSAQAWVKQNVTTYNPGKKDGVNIKIVTVGNEAFLTSYNGTYINITYPAMKNIYKALNEAGYGNKQIKVSTPVNGDVYTTTSYRPSDGVFRPDIKDVMIQICEFLQENESPFIVNIYPFFNLYQTPGFPEEYAFFDNNGNFSLEDHGAYYTNVFDANVDNLVASMRKAKFDNLKIVVGEVGWPSDGNVYATPKNAQRFYNGLFKKLAEKKGTPLMPNLDPEVYLFCLLDENFKSTDPGLFERHWGMFTFDGQPKYPMDLSGKGQNKMLVGAKNVPYLAKQWCVHNKEASNQQDLPEKVGYACNNTDCTSIAEGASCGGISADMNASVAFNMYYQMQDQNKKACDFQGLAKITTNDPSTGNCHFPIMIKKYVPSSHSHHGHHSGAGYSSSYLSLPFLFQIVVGICLVLFA
ncbi:Glycoside hydrolase, family 17 [Corchorus capsularis]|uniref:glucan endo-1,3-beta-D-glucosidase n=1 Tax=Corchorus capsularis TaxID=210143 RepID=A0A1R3GCS3_COCAP|nr:Glycoside hydrolase, family 17 [Corchorus capsularis]